ncbi:MAG: aldo/keto reductase [Bacteroidota bacterium]
MNYRKFGNTDLNVSEVGFGAWGIGGPAMAGEVPIGWGSVDDSVSAAALKKSFELGINFYDTADFYGLGHSEELIGSTFGGRKDVIIATKVGHRISPENKIMLDYSAEYIIQACESSLRRLRRDTIDYYQLHSARMEHLRQGECVEAMERLKKEGKIRYWGLSLNTFSPEPESEFLIGNKLADGFQLVLNIMNQRALGVVRKSAEAGYGVIARMPLQFGLLTGKFSRDTTFEKNDHRNFRLTPDILCSSLDVLEEDVWPLAEKYNIGKTSLSMSYILSYAQVSTVIPGIKTPAQAEANTMNIISLDKEDMKKLESVYDKKFSSIVSDMK